MGMNADSSLIIIPFKFFFHPDLRSTTGENIGFRFLRLLFAGSCCHASTLLLNFSSEMNLVSTKTEDVYDNQCFLDSQKSSQQELELCCEWQMKLLTTWFIDLWPFSNVKLRPQVLAGHLMGAARESLVLPFKQSLIAQQMSVVGPHTTGWHRTTHWLTLDHTPAWYWGPNIFIDSVSMRYLTQGRV